MLTSQTKLTQSCISDSPSASYVEYPLCLGANSRFSSMPSLTTAEQSALSTTHPSHGSLHTSIPTAMCLEGFRVAPDSGTSQSQWSGTNCGLSHNHAPISQVQDRVPCGWSRDLEPLAVPNIPALPFPFSPAYQGTELYPNLEQFDAWMYHVLGKGVDTCSPSPDGDTSLSASGFLRSFANYDFPLDARADPQPSIGPTHPVISPTQSQSAAFPWDEPICRSDRSTRVYECRWITNGVLCDSRVAADRRRLVEHLQHAHGIRPGEEKARETCFWEGCKTVLNKESLARHILTVHLKERAHCADCGLWFAREDSLKRHLKGSQHNANHEKSATKRSPSRNRQHRDH